MPTHEQMTLDRGEFIKLTAAASFGGIIATADRVAAQNLETVRALSLPIDPAKQILYSMQAGIFRKHGLQVELSAMGSGAAMFAAVVGGSAEFGAGSLFSVFSAYGRGIPVRIVAPIAVYDTDRCDSWLLVRKDSPFHTPRDLNGKVMGADAPNDIYVASTRAWIDQHGGDGKSIRSLGLNASEQLTALDQGRVDLVVLKPPFLTLAMGSGRMRALGKPLDAIAPRFLLSCWIATTDYIAKNPATVKAFVAGLTEGGHYTNRHQAETIDMVAQFAKQDPTQLREGVRTVIAESVSLADIQKPLDFAYNHGVIDKQYDAKVMLSSFVPMTRTV
jgi:NitT/TauT family transport system substrate-binding protein